MPRHIRRRHSWALQTLQISKDRHLTLGELPRGVGRGVMSELARRGLAEPGASERFRSQEAWRITPEGAAFISAPRSPVALD
jgi:hypothetical protein